MIDGNCLRKKSVAQVFVLLLSWYASGEAQELNPSVVQVESQAKAESDANSERSLPTSGDIVLIRGADGTSEYGLTFDRWLARWKEAALRWKVHVHLVGSTDRSNSPDGPTTSGSSREQLLQLLEQLPRDGDRPLWLVMIGHGTFSSSPTPSARFNLVGPDLSADELGQSLRPFTRPLVVINCSSCSGGFLTPLAGANRMIVTATRSGNEKNYARFGGYLADALHDASSDRDHDGAVSLLEAFLTASAQVERFYKDAGRLASEHALLEDNGDGQGVTFSAFAGVRPRQSRSSEGRVVDGAAAHRLQLLEVEPQQDLTAEQMRRRDELEEAIDQLRATKDSMPLDEYYQKLERLLIELAQLLNPAVSQAS